MCSSDLLDKLILDYEKLIYVVMKYFKNYPNKEDLFQVGCIGLINAYNNYNSNTNVKFSTYAYSYILGEMKKLVREDKGIKVSRNISKLYLQIDKTYSYLSQKLMRAPTLQEIAHFLEIDEVLLSEALDSIESLPALSLSETCSSITTSSSSAANTGIEKFDIVKVTNSNDVSNLFFISLSFKYVRIL